MKFYYLVNNEKVYIEESGQLFAYKERQVLPADASEHPHKLDMTKNRVDLFFDAEELNDYVLEHGLDDSLIIPCHRVVGADGSLTGYAGGMERKQWLLALEKESGGPR